MFSELFRRKPGAPVVSKSALLAIVLFAFLSITIVVASIVLYDLANLRRAFQSNSVKIFDNVAQRFRENEHLLNSVVILQKNQRMADKERLTYFVSNSLKQYNQIHGFYQYEYDASIPRTKLSSDNLSLLLSVNHPQIDQAATIYLDSNVHKIVAKNLQRSQRVLQTLQDPASNQYYYLVHRTRTQNNRIRLSVLAIQMDELISGVVAKLPKRYALTLLLNDAKLYSRGEKMASRSWFNFAITGLEFTAQNASTMQPVRFRLDRTVHAFDLRLHWMLFGVVLCILINYMLFYIYKIKLRSAKVRQRAREQIFKERERAVVSLGSVDDAVIITNYDGSVEYMNPVAETMTGISLNKVIGKDFFKCFKFVDNKGQKSIFNPVHFGKSNGEPLHVSEDLYLQQYDKQFIPVSGSISPIKNHSGEGEGLVVVFRDIGEAKALEDKLRYEATHDYLTGLYNRREFTLRLDAAISRAVTDNKHSVILYLDMDHFKIVNDTCGHMVGDQLIAEVATLLESKVKFSDTIARLGGDEFAILLENCTLLDAEFVAKRIIGGVKRYHFSHERKVFDVAVSIGLMEVKSDMYSVSELITRADAACYQAKDRGGNRYHIYHENDPSIKKRRGEMEWVQRIKQALQDDRFELYIQQVKPLKSPKDEGRQHYEVLLRMLDSDDNVILPMDYIMAAERYDKMVELDQWVIRNAIMALHRLHKAFGKTTISFGINLSGQSINDSSTVDFVKSLLEQYPDVASSIIFEITETSAIDRFAKASRMINAIRALGCRFALDDFGTGLSSLSYLKNLPVDFIKIDGQFIRDFNFDPISREMVYSISRIAKVMNIKIIAEYIEDETTAKKLSDVGVEYGQGSWFGTPFAVKTLMGESSVETA